MDTNQSIQKLYKNANNDVVISCPNCHHSKAVNITKFKKLFAPIKVRCNCKNSFYVSIESREYYRKNVRLHGTYFNHKTQCFDYIYIENLSLSGIGFKTNMKCGLRVEDLIELKFVLDNNKQTEVCKKGIVRRVQDRSVGVEFCDMSAYSAELGFYLMPS